MFCSFIIPTIGRDSINKTVRSILQQDFDKSNYEIIIVNDSGKELPDFQWQYLEQIKIINNNKRERNFARNSGAAIARGQYFWFLDDDDWILPRALDLFWNLSKQHQKAAWLYGGIQIIGVRGELLTELNSGLNGYCFEQVLGGAWVPIQASLIASTAFFQVGGFYPHILGTEDLDICIRVSYLGELANTPENVACLFRGDTWSTTTNYRRATEDIQTSRNNILGLPKAFTRLVHSADTAYWYGRIMRVYLSSVHWNIRHRRFFTMMSRIIYSLFVAIKGNKYLLDKTFWAGLRADHVPGSLHFVMKSKEQEK
jgi:glycosyltransferase involved in cell wall biosynthesis